MNIKERCLFAEQKCEKLENLLFEVLALLQQEQVNKAINEIERGLE